MNGADRTTALPFEDELAADLDELSEAGLLREARHEPEGCVSFASNDYLGLRRDPRVVEGAARALREFGAGSGSSRLIGGTLPLTGQLESRLAGFKGYERALVFPTGYQAALGIVSALVGRGDEVFLDKLSHASLIDGARLSGARLRTYRHCSVDGLRRLLDRPPRGRRLVITDGLFSMDGDLAPLGEIGRLCAERSAALMVDEAHATGCLGERGRGAAEALGAEGLVSLSMGTLSKALGSMGGFVCGSAAVIDYLVNRSRGFIYTTAPAPALLGAALAALDVVEAEPERRRRLSEGAGRLRRELREAGLEVPEGRSQILPVVAGENAAALGASAFLRERGFHCPAVRYPTVPRGSARLRISVCSEHTPEQLAGLRDALIAWGGRG